MENLSAWGTDVMISWMTDCFIDWLAAVDLATTLKLSEGDRLLFCFFVTWKEAACMCLTDVDARAEIKPEWCVLEDDMDMTVTQCSSCCKSKKTKQKFTKYFEQFDKNTHRKKVWWFTMLCSKSLTSIKYSPLMIFSVYKSLLSLFLHYISIQTHSLACKLSICFSGCELCISQSGLPVRIW